jgi:hypothetical protein
MDMDAFERLEAFWAGERPDRIPYTIYSFLRDSGGREDPAWGPMYEAGLTATCGLEPFKHILPEIEKSDSTTEENGRKVWRGARRTPVGEITTISVDSWRQKFWIETAQDYRVMTWMVEHTRIEPDYDMFKRLEQKLGKECMLMGATGRTPLQVILVDYVGLENFSLHLADFEEEMLGLYEALLKAYRRRVDIVAGGPGKYASVLENFTAETMGPKRYERFHVPVYEECFPTLKQAGKIVGVHYDGKLASCKEAVADAPFELIESLTPPPEGDMTLAEARAAWPDKLFWSNINVGCYELPPAELKRLVLERVRQAAPDGRRLAFEVSEHLPKNWRESIPVVLEALRETEE